MINYGWYTVYILLLLLNGVINRATHSNVWTWHYWAYAAMLILCFVAGANYKE